MKGVMPFLTDFFEGGFIGRAIAVPDRSTAFGWQIRKNRVGVPAMQELFEPSVDPRPLSQGRDVERRHRLTKALKTKLSNRFSSDNVIDLCQNPL